MLPRDRIVHKASPQTVSDFHIFVFTSQKLTFMLQIAHRAEQKTSPSQMCDVFQLRTKGEINKSAEMRGT